jgi:hypothetical protein
MILPFAIIGDGGATPDDGAFTARFSMQFTPDHP